MSTTITSNNVIFNDNTQQSELNIVSGQTWQNVGSSRVLNTTYTNSTSKPITVCICVKLGNKSAQGASINIDGVTRGKIGSVNSITGGTNLYQSQFVVKPGSTYAFATISGTTPITIQSWTELR